MTIKETAEKSGLAQANIRFYEAEGLIAPNRRPNGYRDYSEEDLRILLRIRLLRSLHIPIEEIKALQAGEGSLAETLERHLEKLEEEKSEVARAQDICRVIRGDGADYATLDAQRYLDQLARQPEAPAIPELTEDAIPRVYAPWRRFFARMLDLHLYTVGWNCVMWGVGLLTPASVGGWGHSLMNIVVPIVLMIFFEPILLAKCGATLGKAILGLSVTDLDGNRLTYEEAYRRTGMVIYRGLGFNIPIYDLVRMFKCASIYGERKQLEWEETSQIALRKDKLPGRIVLYLVVCVVVSALVALMVLKSVTPDNKADRAGNMTVAEFCDNYNQLAKTFDLEGASYLGPDGAWVERPKPDNAIVFILYDPPEMKFTEKDGYMTGLSFRTCERDGTPPVGGYQNEMYLSVQAYVGARGKYGVMSKELRDLSEIIANNPYMPFDEEVSGVRVSLQPDPEWTGDEHEWPTMIFTMEKVE